MEELTVHQALLNGIDAHKAGRITEADRYYTAILKTDPKHPDANHNLGILAISVGKIEEALPFLKKALETAPDNSQFWCSYINALIKIEHFEVAQIVLDLAKTKATEFDRLETLQAEINASRELSKKTDIPNIMVDSKKSSLSGITKEDIFPPDKQKLLLDLYEQGNFTKALNEATEFLATFSNSSVLHNILGGIYKELAQFDDAINEFRKAISINPDYASAFHNMGNVFKTQGKIEEAIESYKMVLEIKPDFLETILMLGKCFKKIGRISESTQCFERASVLDPDNISGAELELAGLGARATPPKTPMSFMDNFYIKKSKTWDNTLNYNGHVLIQEAFSAAVRNKQNLRILDLGCGTGSLAKFLRPFSETLNGLDSSCHMLTLAEETKLYDNLYEEDIEIHLQNNLCQYNVIIAAAVFIHFFDLQHVLSLARDRLVNGGEILFSIFESSTSEKHINDFLMYSHSRQYIVTLAEKLQFSVVYEKKAVHEYDGKEPIYALIYILKKELL